MIPRSTRSNISRAVRVGVSEGLGVGEWSGVAIRGGRVAVASSCNVGRGGWVFKIWLSWASAVATMEGVAEGSRLEHATKINNKAILAAERICFRSFTRPRQI